MAEEQTVYKELVSMFDAEKQTKDKEQGYLPKLEQAAFYFKPSRLGFRNESDKLFQF